MNRVIVNTGLIAGFAQINDERRVGVAQSCLHDFSTPPRQTEESLRDAPKGQLKNLAVHVLAMSYLINGNFHIGVVD
jgi:hypothetical protein